jgi:Apea-like HEPN
VPTPNLLEEALASIMMDSRIKELLGRQATASEARGSSDAEQWQALLAALSAGLCAQSDRAMTAAATCLQAEFSAIVSSKGKKWLAFIPLTGAHYGQTNVSFGLDTLKVPCAILPVLSGTARVNALQEIAQRFAAETPGPDESQLQQVTFVSVCNGPPSHAAQEAVAHLAVVRDAVRYAHLVTEGAPGFGLGPSRRYDANAIHRLEVLLCPMTGGTPSIEPVWSADVSLDVDALIYSSTQWRMWYDCAVQLLVTTPETHTAGASLTVGPRLTRSIRVISRASSQSNLDLRFLLCLVALETLVSVKHEDIAESVADIGARVMARDAAERHKVFRDLKEAYNTRSRFVHAGEIPSLVLEARVFEQLQALVLTVWCEVSRRFFDLADRGLTDKQLATGLDDFRGIAQFRYGAPWEEAFSHAGDPAEREDIT